MTVFKQIPRAPRCSLSLARVKGSKNWYVRGQIGRRRVFQTLGTPDRAEAERLLDRSREANAAVFAIIDRERSIPGYPSYRATVTGDILNQLGEKLPQSFRKGYLFVTVDRKQEPVHRLVCAAFYGSPPAGAMALHADDNKTNNDAHNLSWGRHRKNALDYKRNHIVCAFKAPESVLAFPRSKYSIKLTETDIILTPLVEDSFIGFEKSDISEENQCVTPI